MADDITQVADIREKLQNPLIEFTNVREMESKANVGNRRGIKWRRDEGSEASEILGRTTSFSTDSLFVYKCCRKRQRWKDERKGEGMNAKVEG